MDNLWTNWNKATTDIPWGVQKVFHDVFTLAEQAKTTLIYGSDYRDGSPCLVNTVGVMLKATGGEGGSGLPMSHFGTIVSLFDRINEELYTRGVNDRSGYVSPLAAELFLYHFGELKDKPVETAVNEAMAPEAFANGVYVEPSDEDLARDMIEAFMKEAPCEIDLGTLSSGSNESETIGSRIQNDTTSRSLDN